MALVPQPKLSPATASKNNCAHIIRHTTEPAFEAHFNSTHSSACTRFLGKIGARAPATSAGVKPVNLSTDWEKPLILIIRQLRGSRARQKRRSRADALIFGQIAQPENAIGRRATMHKCELDASSRIRRTVRHGNTQRTPFATPVQLFSSLTRK